MTNNQENKKYKRIIETTSQHPRLNYSAPALEELFHYLDTLDHYTLPEGDISIVFLSDSALAKLHDDFMQDPSPTDVITFPGDKCMHFAGEICVSVDCAERVASDHGSTFAQELTLYLVHGWLHLCGYNDINNEDRLKMRDAERDVLKPISNIPTFSLKDEA